METDKETSSARSCDESREMTRPRCCGRGSLQMDCMRQRMAPPFHKSTCSHHLQNVCVNKHHNLARDENCKQPSPSAAASSLVPPGNRLTASLMSPRRLRSDRLRPGLLLLLQQAGRGGSGLSRLSLSLSLSLSCLLACTLSLSLSLSLYQPFCSCDPAIPCGPPGDPM